MEQRPRIEVQWIMDAPEEAREIEDLFGAEGVVVDVRQKPPVGDGIGFYIPVWVFDVGLIAFITGFAGAAGADAWKRTKRLVVGARDALVRRYSTPPPGDRCTLILRHVPTNTLVYVSSDMPDEAFQELHEMELHPGATYAWDEDRGWEISGPEPPAQERPANL